LVRVAVAIDVAVGGATVAVAGGGCVALGGGALVAVARGAPSSSSSSWPAHAVRKSSRLSEVAVTARVMRDACLIALSFSSSRSRPMPRRANVVNSEHYRDQVLHIVGTEARENRLQQCCQ
jgi:hypothetical protein